MIITVFHTIRKHGLLSLNCVANQVEISDNPVAWMSDISNTFSAQPSFNTLHM